MPPPILDAGVVVACPPPSVFGRAAMRRVGSPRGTHAQLDIVYFTYARCLHAAQRRHGGIPGCSQLPPIGSAAPKQRQSMRKQLLNHGRLAQGRAPHPLQQVCHLLPLSGQRRPASTQLCHQLVEQRSREEHLQLQAGRVVRWGEPAEGRGGARSSVIRSAAHPVQQPTGEHSSKSSAACCASAQQPSGAQRHPSLAIPTCEVRAMPTLGTLCSAACRCAAASSAASASRL